MDLPYEIPGHSPRSRQGNPYQQGDDPFAVPPTGSLDEQSLMPTPQQSGSSPTNIPTGDSWELHKLQARLKFYRHLVAYVAAGCLLGASWSTTFFMLWVMHRGSFVPFFLYGFSFLWIVWGIFVGVHFYNAIIWYRIVESHIANPQDRIKMLIKKP